MRVCNGENFSSSKYKTNTEDGLTSVIESYKTFELNNIDLDNYLEQEILENPLLEKINDENIKYQQQIV